jgi:hypothetical protein
MSTATTSQEDFDQFESLQKALTPFFYTEVREPKSGKVRSVFGPFVSLPTETQRAGMLCFSPLLVTTSTTFNLTCLLQQLSFYITSKS